MDEDGSISIYPKVQPVTRSSGVAGFKTETALLNDLKRDFAPYTKKVLSDSSQSCPALGKHVNVRVTETRDTYTRKSADYKNFVLGTTLTVIATFLGVSSPVASTILSMVGITVSASNTITEAAKLYRSAVYRYSGNRRGYVYDTTRYNQYVRVIQYAGTGEFTGGYASNGVFTWVHSTICSAFDQTTSNIISRTISNYNADIASHGSCTLYSPD